MFELGNAIADLTLKSFLHVLTEVTQMEGIRMGSRVVLGLLVLFFISGCTSDIYRQFNIDQSPPTSLSLDAKQRVVLVTGKGGMANNSRIICAEPSPDIAASLQASGSLAGSGNGEALIKLDTQSVETLTRLTKRNSTIQLLRDALYRACEAYMNGAISNIDYRDVLIMYDDMVITLLSIEEISQMRRGVIPVADESPKMEARNKLGEAQVRDGAAEIRTIVLKYLENQMELYKWEREDQKEKRKDVDRGK